MSVLDVLANIVENENLVNYPFKYCLVTETKLPYTISNTLAKPNQKEDFCTLQELLECGNLQDYAGLGISIIESKISAIDVDKCFSIPFELNSGDERAKDIIEMFKDKAYIEFSFSGRGLRIFFSIEDIKDYTKKYYIKNSKNSIEYYQPGNSARYVTITGRTIYNNSLYKMKDLNTIEEFLNKYMVRPQKSPRTTTIDIEDNRTIDEILKKVKGLYLKSLEFQNLWFETEHEKHLFCHIPGKSLESDADFHLLSLLFNNITTNKEKLRLVFEESPYFKTKDSKHKYKWNYNNFRYYNYIYDRLK